MLRMITVRGTIKIKSILVSISSSNSQQLNTLYSFHSTTSTADIELLIACYYPCTLRIWILQ